MNDRSVVTAPWLSTQFPDLQDIQPLSSGGQKQVFTAIHKDYGEVVLKIMHPNSDIERTEREIYAVAQVQSPRIPKIIQYGKVTTPVGDCFWFVEQRIQGLTVREQLESGPFKFLQLLQLAKQISETLAAAEDVHIVHRDVKPEI